MRAIDYGFCCGYVFNGMKAMEKDRAYKKEYARKTRDQLNDSYIKALFIKELNIKEPGKQAIDQKRLQIKLKRLIYEKQRTIKPSRNHDVAI